MRIYILIAAQIIALTTAKGQWNLRNSIPLFRNHQELLKKNIYVLNSNIKKPVSFEEYNKFGKIVKYTEYEFEDKSEQIRNFSTFYYLNDSIITKKVETLYNRNDIDEFMGVLFEKNKECYKELKSNKSDSLVFVTNYSFKNNKVILVSKIKNYVIDSVQEDYMISNKDIDLFGVAKDTLTVFSIENNRLISKQMKSKYFLEVNYYRSKDSLLTSSKRFHYSNLQGDPVYIDTLIYDQDDRLINRVTLYSMNQYFPFINCQYYQNGDSIIKTEYYSLKRGFNPLITKKVFLHGKLIEEETIKFRKGMKLVEEVKYNSKGDPTESTRYDNTFKTKYHYIYEYIYKE